MTITAVISEVNVTAMLDISELVFGLIFGVFRIVFLWDFIFEAFHLITRMIFYILRKTRLIKGMNFLYIYLNFFINQINLEKIQHILFT